MDSSGDVPNEIPTLTNLLDQNTTTYSPTTGNDSVQSPEIPYWDLPTRIFFSLLISALIVAAVVGNTLVILVIARNRGMQTRTNIFLCNLAVSDLACALFDMPISLVTMIAGQWVFNDVICQLNGFTTTLFMATSIHTLMYISIHKYLSIRNPFIRGFRRKWICTMLAAAWAWATILGYLTVHGLNHVSYKPYTSQCGPEYPHGPPTYAHFGIALGSCYILPVCIMTGCYIGVFMEMKAHSERLQKNTTIEKDRVLQQQRRIAVTIFFVMATVIICWLPYNIFNIYVISLDDKDKIKLKANPFIYLFCYVNNAVNPVIYALRSGAFREGYKQIICWRTTEYWPSDPQYNSVMRKFSRMKSMLRESLEAQLIETASRNGSLPCSRRNSSNSLAHTYGLGKARTISTTSLPQHLTFGTPNSLTRQRKLKLNNVKRGTLKTFLRMFSRSSDKEAIKNIVENGHTYNFKSSPVADKTLQMPNVILYNIPEITVSNLDDGDVTEVLLQSPEPAETDKVCWEQESELERNSDVYSSNVTPSVTPCYTSALTSGVNIMVAGLIDPEPIEQVTSYVPEFQYASSETSSVSYETHSPIISIHHEVDQSSEDNASDRQSSAYSSYLLSPNCFPEETKELLSQSSSTPKKMSKCASAPILDKQGEESRIEEITEGVDLSPKPRHTIKDMFKSSFRRNTHKKGDGSDRFRRTKSEKHKNIKRCPSVEKLDHITPHKRPSKNKMPKQRYIPPYQPKNNTVDVNKTRRTSEGDKIERKSWFMRENRIDIRNILNFKVKDHRREKNNAKLFHKELPIKKPVLGRSISDPCLTFKMIEERASVRAATKHHRKNTRKTKPKGMHRVETVARDTLQVMSCIHSFVLPEAGKENRKEHQLYVASGFIKGNHNNESRGSENVEYGDQSENEPFDGSTDESPKKGVVYQIGGEDLIIGPPDTDNDTDSVSQTRFNKPSSFPKDVHHPLKNARLVKPGRKQGVHNMVQFRRPIERIYEHSLSDPGCELDEGVSSRRWDQRANSDSLYQLSPMDRLSFKGLFSNGSGINRETVL